MVFHPGRLTRRYIDGERAKFVSPMALFLFVVFLMFLIEGGQHAKDNPALLAYKLKVDGYKFSWALIPLSVPLLWLLFFWRRDIHLYDHAIFNGGDGRAGLILPVSLEERFYYNPAQLRG